MRLALALALSVALLPWAAGAQVNTLPPDGPHVLGVFVGTLPCADCRGLKTELTLFMKGPNNYVDATFFLRETYLGTREGDKAIESRGEWTILRGSATDRNATVYQLDPDKKNETRFFLKIGDDQLRMLDRERRAIDAPFDLSLKRLSPVGLAGGYQAAPVTSDSIRRAADFAVADRARTSGQAVALAGVVRAEQQVVAGMNYRLCLDVTVAGKPARVLATVYRDLNNQRTLTAWTAGACE
jgi:copper homeostasis protein (lipoprotein)